MIIAAANDYCRSYFFAASRRHYRWGFNIRRYFTSRHITHRKQPNANSWAAQHIGYHAQIVRCSRMAALRLATKYNIAKE